MPALGAPILIPGVTRIDDISGSGAGRVEQSAPLKIASTPNSGYLSRSTKIVGGGD